MSDIEIPDWVRPGTVYRMDYGKGHFANVKYHICAIVDGDQVVFRFWHRRGGWAYRVEPTYMLAYRAIESQHFRIVKVGKE